MKKYFLAVLLVCTFGILTGCGTKDNIVGDSNADFYARSELEARDLNSGDSVKPELKRSSQTKSANTSTSYGRHIGSSDGNYDFVTDGNFFYYFADEGKKIVKQSVQNGSQVNLYLAPDRAIDCEYLNISGEWLYFTLERYVGSYYDQKQSICKIRTDGTGLSVLYEFDSSSIDKIHDMLIVDDKIYFVRQIFNKNQEGPAWPWLMCMNLDGSGLEQLIQGSFFYISAFERQLLLMMPSDRSFIVFDIDTRSNHIVKPSGIQGGDGIYLQVSQDGKLYLYINGTANSDPYFCSFNLDGSDLVYLNPVLDRFIIVEDKILFYDYSDSNIYSRPLDGSTAPIKITDRAVHKWFGYHNGYLFASSPDRQDIYIFPVQTGQSATQPPTVPTSLSNFTDVSASAYYADPVKWAVENNITSGTSSTTFSPDETCSTAQILAFLHRANGSPEPTSNKSISNIKPTDWFYKPVLWANEKGLISGKTFDGNEPCTRSATVTYLWKLAGSPSAPLSSFADVPNSADYAKAVAWAVSEGITSGTSPSTFAPNDTCTRGQIVTFLFRTYSDNDLKSVGI